jgi:hypothetical protein
MDQVKKFLKIAVANRFWILCVVAALMPMIGYFVGAGKIATATDAKAKDIESAYKGVDAYKSGKLPNPQWKSLADAKTAKLTEEVNVAWKKLYEKQAPLLKWPVDRVEETLRRWGRTYPEAKEADAIPDLIQDYINFYPEYVTSIRNSFRPFNFEDGKGVVVAPDEAALLRPDKFEISKLPNLSRLWKEQEKLWVSQAVLDVVNQVNKSAQTWDQAPIKQLITLEVACDAALDPMSKTKGVALVDPPNILAPGEEEVASEEGAAAEGGMAASMGGGMPGAGYGAPPSGGKGGMMEMGMGGMMGGMGGGAVGGTKTAPDLVQFLPAPEGVEKPPYFIVPILLTTLIEQDRVADLLVELENSPMAIQVMSLELAKPSIKVQKPEKGDSTMLGYGGMTGMMGGRGGMGMGMMDMMGGMPGGGAGYEGMMGGMMGGRGGMAGGMMPGGGYEGMMGGMGGMQDARKGTDVRSRDRRKEREEAEKSIAKKARMSLQDPYYNVVEVSVYGQARFYNPPPPPEAPASDGSAAEGIEAKPADGAEKPAAEGTEAKPADGAEKPAAEEPKKEAADAASETPKS